MSLIKVQKFREKTVYKRNQKSHQIVNQKFKVKIKYKKSHRSKAISIEFQFKNSEKEKLF